MNSLELELHNLVEFLSELRIAYVILGGLAVSIYGEPRLTADIDVNIMLDKTELDGFLKKAKDYGFYPIPSDIKRFTKKTGVIPMKFSKGKVLGRCDFIIAENLIEYSGIKRGRLKKIGPIKARFISPEDLIIHKITSSRPRDIEDVEGILIRQRDKLDIRYINNWLKKIAIIAHKPELLTLFKGLVNYG